MKLIFITMKSAKKIVTIVIEDYKSTSLWMDNSQPICIAVFFNSSHEFWMKLQSPKLFFLRILRPYNFIHEPGWLIQSRDRFIEQCIYVNIYWKSEKAFIFDNVLNKYYNSEISDFCMTSIQYDEYVSNSFSWD